MANSLGSLPDDAGKRNEYPMADGLLDYFPNALAEVARLSYVATQQHHPDKPMHWDRSKSTDHRNKIMRHLVDTGKFDDKGMRHSTMVAWRALALLQEELEIDEGFPLCRAAQRKFEIDALDCPSCGGLNISHPDGCGRDPKTGELNGGWLSMPETDEVEAM